MLLGSVLVIPSATVDVGAVVTTLGILAQVLREERHLRGIFGERYARYVARTGRFAPRLLAR